VAAVVGVLVIAGIIVASASGGGEHKVRAVFDSAEQLAPGQELRMAGRKVGKVGKIETYDGHHAVVVLRVFDDKVWPLHRGTTADTRWGSTTSLAYRYVELHPGPASAPALPNDAVLPVTQNRTAVELDQAYRIFRGRTRGDLRGVLRGLADTFYNEGPALRRGLSTAPGGLDQAAAVLREFSADQHALSTMMVAGDAATSALAGRQGDLEQLVHHAAATFDEFARHTRAEQASLERAPSAFSESVGTLSRLDTSLDGLQALLDDLRPGARQLRVFAAPARRALAELRREVPIATATFRTGRLAAPPLTRMLKTGTTFLPHLGNVLDQFAPMMACLRPYAPELAGNLGTWTGWNKNYDEYGHYARTFDLQANLAILPGTPFNSLQATNMFKNRLFYAMPRPPGLNAGHPWFQPQCGAGPDSMDPSKDPEGAGK
jgi:ABC-type transporter Mla subunit MlaD